MCGPVSETFIVSQPDPITMQVDNIVDILCHGEATGSIELTITGGTPAYEFEWTGPNFTANTEDIFNLVAEIIH